MQLNISTMNCPTHIRQQHYKTLVRPQLEYESSVWGNNVKRNIDSQIGSAAEQHAACITRHDYRWTSSVTAMTMLQKLQLDSFQQ